MNNDITRIYGLLGMDYLSIPEDIARHCVAIL